MVDPAKRRFVSRAGEKLDFALDAFELDVSGMVCADFGCNVGGFTDCLLQRGARSVYAVDTGYGELAWTLRKDERVTVMERTNALYCDPPEGGVDLVTIDVAWTPQELSVPAAFKWLRPSRGDEEPWPGPCVVSLLKPHYEQQKLQQLQKNLRGRKGGRKPIGLLSDEKVHDICAKICQRLSSRGAEVLAIMRSPLRGKGGNAELLMLIVPRAAYNGSSGEITC